MNLEGKLAVVTGGASGLGQATCRALVARGARVAIFDLNEEQAQETRDELGADKACYELVNVTDESSVEAGIEAAVKRFGEIHLLVNCAGIAPPAKVINREGEPLALDKYRQIIDINLIGTFNVLRLVAARMARNTPINEDNGRGVIVNVASVAAFDGQIGQPAYAASKAGVVGMTLPIAREFATHGIRVNAIAPGLFMTPMAASLPEEVVQALGNSVEYPKRLGHPDEFAQLVVQIAENDYLNGEVIRLDGGIRMQAR
ncbi:SDR family NAD(P)-dependent oxidoreductase [Aestuariirhabdus sp. Z084]|uniref:SDR family NAD(P)-dependent oxidoreductase n=1 Tax=Aestuariirhabdus haliotis TaxID=2918751 RepID=UPI00201B3529|nr:SDR family NAD(P)-dependent oxidoreductase [Aestuariirhabdus haliotis]MCL6417686.1 SDR family NAD(P)-dependent oxidoreductase [Aestuariirhabdus haliotis]MCL6421625.1 SDR family NAD(P)-dependent oxidoreductase [Aestuariirhabdus haliotis]